MGRPRAVLIALLSCLAAPVPAGADDHVVDGPLACEAIGGTWESSTCRFRRLIIGAGEAVVVSPGVGLSTDGTSFNYGRLHTRGTFHPVGEFVNRGTLVTEGLTVPGGVLTNAGTFTNRGWIHTHGTIQNRGVLENAAGAILETCSGPVVNHAYLHNAGALDNWGALVVNHGVLVNDGSTYNPDADSYQILDAGAFENRGAVWNGGTFAVPCGGAVYGDGEFYGIAPSYGACDTASAARLLISRVYALAQPEAPALSKTDALALARLLAAAAKGPSLTPEAALDLYTFIDLVQAWQASGALSRHLAAALVGWAERILAMPPAG